MARIEPRITGKGKESFAYACTDCDQTLELSTDARERYAFGLTHTSAPTYEERRREPKNYWCVRVEGKEVLYFWGEEPISKEEYEAETGDTKTC